MLLSRLLSVYILGLFTFSSVETSEISDKKPKRRLIRRSTPFNTGSDDELFAEETKPNPASGLPVSIPSDAGNEDMELTESVKKAKSKPDHMKYAEIPRLLTREEILAERRIAVEESKPLDLAEKERDISESFGKDNVMAKIMKRYRQDVGFTTRDDLAGELYTNEEILAQMQPLVECLGENISDFTTNPPSPNLIEALIFMRKLNFIPQNLSSLSPQQCEDFKKRLRIKNVAEMLTFYQREFKNYTHLNWDLLDLTHFEYQSFPIIDRIVKTFPKINNYERKGVMTVTGMKHLKDYVDLIRFHNPRNRDGRAMIIFQKLYHLYYKAVKRERAHPSFINWSHCDVDNWPEGMSKTDMSTWTVEQMRQMVELIKNKQIKFRFTKKGTVGGFLGNVPGFDKKPVIAVDFATVLEKKADICSLSDSEEVCGKVRIVEKRAKAQTSILKAKSKQSPKKQSQKSPRFVPSTTICIKTDEKPSGMDIPIGPRTPADPETRAQLLEEVKQIYLEDTGDEGEIDWSAMQVSKFNLHVVPEFSPNFETNADIQIVQELIKHNALAFLNTENLIDSRIRTYERIYRIYREACGIYANPFDVYFEDMYIEGWPAGVGEDLDNWEVEDIAKINEALHTGAISMKPNKRFQDEIDHEIAKLLKKSSPTSQSQVKTTESTDKEEENSPSSTGSCIDLVSSDEPVEMNRTRRSMLLYEPKQDDDEEEEQPTQLNSGTPGYNTYLGILSNSSMSNEDENERKSLKRSNDNPQEDEGSAHISKASKLMMLSARATVDEIDGYAASDIVQDGECAGSTYYGVNYMRERTRSILSGFRTARSAYSPDSRHYRIYSLILDCLNILLGHMDASFDITMMPPRLPMNEASQYLEIFQESLRLINEAGEMSLKNLRTYVVAAVKFRARLAGCSARNISHTTKKSVIIPLAKIENPQDFAFVSHGEKKWPDDDLEFLELALFGSEPFFRA